MLAYNQPAYVLRRAEPGEAAMIAYLRMASLVSLEMPRHSLDAVRAVMAGVPDADPDQVMTGDYYVADHGGDLIGGAGWSVLPLQYRSDRIVSEDGGTAYVSLDRGSVLMRGFFLDPDLGRRGVGRRLLSHVEAEATEAGFGSAEIIVPADAQIYYRSLGFKPVRRLAMKLDEGDLLPILQMRRPFAACLAAAA